MKHRRTAWIPLICMALTLAAAPAWAFAGGQPGDYNTGGNGGKKTIHAGAIITFGTYPQTSAGKDSTPIKWVVLEYDAYNNRALLLSLYALDCKPYNTNWTGITWETCSLRKWLNGTFLATAFSAKERTGIAVTTVDNSARQGYRGWNTSGGKNTEDYVFLLSYAEAWRYFGSDSERQCEPTKYAAARGVFLYNNDHCWWWLRSPGPFPSTACDVFSDGVRDYIDVYYAYGAVRPALWVDLGADIF